jgi:Tol biopolymer transport system component
MRNHLTLLLLLLGCVTLVPGEEPAPLALPEEARLHNVRQLTFGGENAEAYFSADDRSLILQASGKGVPCDQIFTLALAPVLEGKASKPELVSTGKGKTTCSYFFPSGERILYSSTHLGDAQCPPRPDYSQGYVWPVYASFDIFTARPDGSDLKRLTTAPGYDAEATVSRDGSKIVFTSVRDGDLDIYSMNSDGTDVRRLTDELGTRTGPTSARSPTTERPTSRPSGTRTGNESSSPPTWPTRGGATSTSTSSTKTAPGWSR